MKILVWASVLLLSACSGTESVCTQSRPCDLFFIYGQSNGAGRALDINTTPARFGELWDVHLKQPRLLQDPTSHDGAIRGSAWPVFSDELYRRSGRQAVILNASYGGRGITDLSAPSPLNGEAFTWLTEALNYYGDRVSSVSMIFVHGEQDAISDTPYDFYFGKLAGLSDQLGQLTPKYRATYIHRVGILARAPVRSVWFGHEQIERTRDRSDWIPASIYAPTFTLENGLLAPDKVHYTQAGYNLIAEDIVSAIVQPEPEKLYRENTRITFGG